MPIVRATTSQSFDFNCVRDATHTPHTLLQKACEQIVPAGLHTKRRKLVPGSIQYLPAHAFVGCMTVDATIEIEAQYYWSRRRYHKTAHAIRAALCEVFPDVKFMVVLKLVDAGWSFDPTDTANFEGDMSMPAAIDRYRQSVA